MERHSTLATVKVYFRTRSDNREKRILKTLVIAVRCFSSRPIKELSNNEKNYINAEPDLDSLCCPYEGRCYLCVWKHREGFCVKILNLEIRPLVQMTFQKRAFDWKTDP